MAAVSANTKEPLWRTIFRFVNAVRQENTAQAVQLLRPHSAGDRLNILTNTIRLIPSPEKTIRSVIQSVYLNNKSESDEDIEEAAGLVSWTESLRLVYNMVLEFSPLLLAIKQGDVDDVRLLLQQLPRREAINLIIKGPDAKSILSMKMNFTEYAERLYNEILRKYPSNDKLRRMISTRTLCVAVNKVISITRSLNGWFSGLQLATSIGSLDNNQVIVAVHKLGRTRLLFKGRHLV